MKNLNRKFRIAVWPMFLCLLISVSACTGNTYLVADGESTSAMRLGKDLQDVPVFIPNEDKTNWIRAKADLKKGYWIFANPENMRISK